MLSGCCLSCLSIRPVCDVGVLWPNAWMNQDETWHARRPQAQPWQHCVKWGPNSPPPKGHSPQFSAHTCCGQIAGWIKMPLGMEIGLGPGDCVSWGPSSSSPKRGQSPLPNFRLMSIVAKRLHGSRRYLARRWALVQTTSIVLDGDPDPPPQERGQSPQFSAHVYYGQTAGRIKMPLGMEVDLGPGHIVLDGYSDPPPPKGQSPQFPVHICCGQMAGWIKMRLGREARLDQVNNVLDGDPAPPPQKGGRAPQFSAHVYCDKTAG